jgi:hypothetical protein
LILPCISLWQPWASLLFVDDPELRKVHETRGFAFPPRHRGQRVAIHAAIAFPKRLPAGLHEICAAGLGWDYRQALPRGAVIGTLVLAETLPMAAAEPASAADHCAGDWTPGRFAWRTEAPQRLEQPIPVKGRQGWFSVDVPGAA